MTKTQSCLANLSLCCFRHAVMRDGLSTVTQLLFFSSVLSKHLQSRAGMCYRHISFRKQIVPSHCGPQWLWCKAQAQCFLLVLHLPAVKFIRFPLSTNTGRAGQGVQSHSCPRHLALPRPFSFAKADKAGFWNPYRLGISWKLTARASCCRLGLQWNSTVPESKMQSCHFLVLLLKSPVLTTGMPDTRFNDKPLRQQM